MSGAASRVGQIAAHLLPQSWTSSDGEQEQQRPGVNRNFHTLSPAFFLPRAAQIEPNAEAIYHQTANGQVVRRSYQEFADRARGFAYFVKKHGWKHVGILCTNTPGFLESLFGIAAAGAVSVAINYRLKQDDIAYIFEHGDCDAIVVDSEFKDLLSQYSEGHPSVPVIEDTDTEAVQGDRAGAFDRAVIEGLEYDASTGQHGWEGLETSAADESSLLSLAYTSGTTARPKGVQYTHRGSYLAAIGNVIESGLNYHQGRCKYLWTLPMFHATGWTFPWAVTSVRGTHYCLRKIDRSIIWKMLREEGITHFNAAPTVNTMLCTAKEAVRLPDPVRVTVAASPPSAHLFQQMTALNLHPVHVYGLTETYGPITKGYHMPEWQQLSDSERFAKMARQGHGFITSLPIRVIKTGDDIPEGQLTDVARDGKEIGEIVFVGNICSAGYYKNPEATRKLFAGGVLHSEDLAVWHPDGAIQILDRAKDIIISGGENISSVALESMLMTHPDILEAAVVALKDEQWGERPVAFVTLQSGKTATGQQIIDWAKTKSNISRFMVPYKVEIIDELPKTSTGKVTKKELRVKANGGDLNKVK